MFQKGSLPNKTVDVPIRSTSQGTMEFDAEKDGSKVTTVGEYELLYLSTCGEGGATPCASEQTPASDK
jgi:hypothetical protein